MPFSTHSKGSRLIRDNQHKYDEDNSEYKGRDEVFYFDHGPNWNKLVGETAVSSLIYWWIRENITIAVDVYGQETYDEVAWLIRGLLGTDASSVVAWYSKFFLED